MIKITQSEFEIGTAFQLRNTWRERIANMLDVKLEKIPVQYKIIDCDATGYLCEQVTDKKSDSLDRLYVSNAVMQYTHGQEVPDCNVGLYLDDFLPLEGSKLIIKDCKNDKCIKPVKLELNIEKIDKDVKLQFRLMDMILDKNYTLKSQYKNSWKLIYGADTYMSDTEKMFQDTFVHKDYVLKVAIKFAEWLRNNGQENDANELLANAKVHDNSKILNKDEFDALTSIINDKSCMRDKNAALSLYKQDAIELHWRNNAHHPEHFKDIREMTRQNRQEAACDWCARSLQYGTDLVDFVQARQQDRFHFPEDIYDEFLGYCKTLARIMH